MPRTPLRIAIFTGVYAPFLSGVSVAVHQRVHWLLQRGHSVFLIHPTMNERFPEVVQQRAMPGLEELQKFSTFSAYAYPTRPLALYKFFPEPLSHRHWSDTELLRAFQPDVIAVEEAPQLRGVYSLFLGGYGRHVGSDYAKQNGIPIVSLFHTDILAYAQYYLGDLGARLLTLSKPLIRRLMQRFTETYDVNYCPSRGQFQKYRNMGAQRLEYLPYQGVNCQKFNPDNICYNPIPDDPRPLLLFVGRIAPEKNLPLLLAAFPLIAEQVPTVHLVIVGAGPQTEPIRQQAAKVSDQITVWGESMGYELLGWFARSDVFVNPSVTENFSTTTMEALASGTPVVAVSATSTAEQITPGVNGFLATPNNPNDFAQKAITLLKDEQMRDKMARQARPSALAFDWSSCMAAFEAHLYELVKAPTKTVSPSREYTGSRL